MSEALFSSSWYRVASLKPRLRSHAQIHRHHYRGELWYILQDHASQRYHRFSPAAYFLIGLMDGQRTVHELWENATARLGDDAPTQDEVIQVLTQLHASDVLQCDVPPDTAELLLRYDRQRRHKLLGQLMSPMFWRFPLFDPERVLQAGLPLVRPLFGIVGALLWLAVVGTAVGLAVMHWQDLSENVIDRVLAPQNLLVLWLVFPILKTLHEFGHAFATKAYGGEVHEMGVMLLVMMPLPYVDASAASAFRSKWRRVVVGAAGMIVELFLAALALFVWLNVEPGTVRVVAYNVMFIAGVSTLLFNGNPLLRYDGYYIFADFLEIPNLRARAHTYIGYLGERYLFGRREAEPGASLPGERVWFVVFAIASFVYRMFVLLAIALFVASKFFFIGVVFAIGGLVTWAIVPLVKLLTHVGTHPRLRRVRFRAITASVACIALLVGVIGWAPVPLRSRAEGVVWIPERAIVRAGIDGFIERLVVAPGSQVKRGDVLLVCRDAALLTRVKVLQLRRQELQTRYTMEWLQDPAQAELVKEEIALVEESLTRARERVAELTIRSQTDGTFVAPQAQDLPGQFVPQGMQLGYVLDLTRLTVRTVVPQAEIDLVRHRTQGVEVRFVRCRPPHRHYQVRRRVVRAAATLPLIRSIGRG
jgi:putative peptide zinc metalloprotease protein